ncbi:Homeodomain-interacting protein [Heracleum sosnowskyi]|uniref:Homeodomain-interacting protein n=1 Tax=Heracleum sosnowskyi TaxID=360622 RepID=A0AAD8I0H0_9APIA|nr:Homeodomain-interacting protein [Heracleum sosnowskyi]
MKLVWSPETASKAYIDTVNSCKIFKDSSVAELISAMAAGWNAKLMVETWSRGGAIATSIGLAFASHHTNGRHVCIVPDNFSRTEYLKAMEIPGFTPQVIVGDPEEAFQTLTGIDFLVLNCEKDNFSRILKVVKLGQRGAVLVSKNVSGSMGSSSSESRWRGVVEGGSRLVRSRLLPVGDGLDIAHVGAVKSSGKTVESRWIRRFDRQSGEEFVFRR